MKKQFKTIARLVKSRRIEVSLSQKELSERLNLGKAGHQFISNVERGMCGIPAKNINDASIALRYPKEKIIEAMVMDEAIYLTKASEVNCE